jgi:uncharacterized protein
MIARRCSSRVFRSSAVRILVDADSLSPRLREMIVRAAGRFGIEAVFAANSPIPLPKDPAVRLVVVDDADEWLVREAQAGDLAISRDVPLAARLVPLGVDVITDRGEHYTRENIGTRLSDRDLATGLREAGLLQSRGRPHRPRDTQAFANLLDRELTRRR